MVAAAAVYNGPIVSAAAAAQLQKSEEGKFHGVVNGLKGGMQQQQIGQMAPFNREQRETRAEDEARFEQEAAKVHP